MMEFKGFLPETIAFFDSFAKNNTRQWFFNILIEVTNNI